MQNKWKEIASYGTEWMFLADNSYRLEVDPEFEHLIDQGLIYRFDKTQYRFLSNFFLHKINYKGKWYESTEHAYQAAKTLDEDWAEAIRISETPGKAKKKGRQCPIRDEWDEIKDAVMSEVLDIKFKDEELRKKLIGTRNNYLVEGTIWHDNYWGICLKSNCERGCQKVTGKNHLGLALMRLRKKLIQTKESYCEKKNYHSSFHHSYNLFSKIISVKP
jgi:N-glycosidase YbiA